jgi:hypothetical protein
MKEEGAVIAQCLQQVALCSLAVARLHITTVNGI